MTRKLRFAGLFGAFALNSPALQQLPTPPPYQEQAPPSQEPKAQQVPDESTLPEEDETEKPQTYVLNPLESERNLKIGNFYFAKKDYRGALSRYEDATRFNPSSAEAFMKVAEAEEKLSHPDRARLAWKKAAEVAPDSKAGKQAKKKLSASKAADNS